MNDEQSGTLRNAIREMAAVMRRHRLGYRQSVYVARKARHQLGLREATTSKRLPKNLTEKERTDFFDAVGRGGNTQHDLMFRLLYVTGLRVAELTGIRRSDVDVENCTMRVNQGKGRKDRTVLFPEELQLSIRLYMHGTPDNEYLFETRRRSRMSERWVQLLTRKYGEAAGIPGLHPHQFRHSLLTDLTRSGLRDAQLMLISGHASKRSLEIYQALALSDVEADYQKAMVRTLRQ